MSINQSTFQYPVSFTYYLIPVVHTHYDQENFVTKQSLVADHFRLLPQVQYFSLHGSLKPSHQIVQPLLRSFPWLKECSIKFITLMVNVFELLHVNRHGNVMLYQQFFIYLVVNSRRYGSSTWQFLQEKYTTKPRGQSRGAMLATYQVFICKSW